MSNHPRIPTAFCYKFSLFVAPRPLDAVPHGAVAANQRLRALAPAARAVAVLASVPSDRHRHLGIGDEVYLFNIFVVCCPCPTHWFAKRLFFFHDTRRITKRHSIDCPRTEMSGSFMDAFNLFSCSRAMQKTAGVCGGRDDGESAREPPRRPDWVPDELVLACPKCDAQFSPIVRRHHCRVCGGVFCSSCTGFKAIIPRLLYNDPVRVCKQCHLKCSAALGIEKAIMSQDYDGLLSSLCCLGADANFTISHEPPMVLAASRGDIRAIRILADRGADVCVSTDGNEVIDQPLICAVENGHLDSVKLLLQLGAANSGYPRRVSDGNTVLHIRCQLCCLMPVFSKNARAAYNFKRRQRN